jgi:hypothetical protein
MKVSEHYGITGEVPFVDVELSCDNKLFVDPHAIRLRKGPEPYAEQAVRSLDSFFNQVTMCVLSGRGEDELRGRSLLQRFAEPWETRLGLARAGFRGHGGAEDVGSWIWDALKHDLEAFVRVGMLRHVEEIPLFVEGVDRDITSDLATRIVFEPLAKFTSEMMERFPEFRAGGDVAVASFVRQVWDSDRSEWTTRELELPVAGGEPLLLVPRGWARGSLLMNSGRFYGTTVLGFAQDQLAVVVAGERLATPKWRLRSREDLAPGRGTVLEITMRAYLEKQDLVRQFRSFVDTRWEREKEAA